MTPPTITPFPFLSETLAAGEEEEEGEGEGEGEVKSNDDEDEDVGDVNLDEIGEAAVLAKVSMVLESLFRDKGGRIT